MPSHNVSISRRSTSHNRRSRNTSNSSSLQRRMAQSISLGMVGTSSDDHLIRSDFTLRPVPPTFTSQPPRNILSQVYWVRQNFGTSFATSTTTFVENNYSFSATTDLLQATQYLQLFDQYYLHSVVITFSNESSTASAVIPELLTAIDFDNTAALGAVASIEAYSSCNTEILAPGKSVTRVVQPCISSTGTTGPLVSRQWVNSGYPTVQFNGLRSIALQTSIATPIAVNIACLWAFRNTV
jgi:hypothetical protein